MARLFEPKNRSRGLEKFLDTRDIFLGTLARYKKQAIAGAAVISVLGASMIAAPFIKTAYKSYQAKKALDSTKAAIIQLETTCRDSELSLDNNTFLMTGPEEIQPMESEIKDSQEKLEETREQMHAAERDYEAKRYDDVRTALDHEFGLEEGTRVTPESTALREVNELKTKVIGYCENKRNLRDAVIANEWFLRARLKKPYDFMAAIELDPEIAEIPAKFRALVTKKTSELEIELRSLPEEIYNSLGENIINHKWAHNHVLVFTKTDSMRTRANQLWQNAHNTYMSVRPANDRLNDPNNPARKWYRDYKHDGTFSTGNYRELLNMQNDVVDMIHRGDNSLSAIDNMVAEMHRQRIVYVSDHRREHTTFSHSRMVSVPDNDEDGGSHMEIEFYDTYGYKFYYTLTTRVPGSTTSREILVGEKDSEDSWSYRSWDYQNDEEVGYLRAWKRFHSGDCDTIRGGKYNPHIHKIQAMPEHCRNPGRK